MVAAKKGIEADVIVRAAGLPWALSIKRFPPQRRKKSPPEVIVIDFDDAYDRHAAAAYEQRLQDYRHRGFAVTVISDQA
jgi:hypothetical protein